jgi:hypothetical protein
MVKVALTTNINDQVCFKKITKSSVQSEVKKDF